MFVHYCSSDLYTGTREASEETGNYIFHGRYIVQAVVEDIIMHAPNLDNLKQLVLMGESAGAYGVGFNCDFVADRFHEVMPYLDIYLCICVFMYLVPRGDAGPRRALRCRRW